MNLTHYEQFIAMYEKLNPFELDRFARILQKSLSDQLCHSKSLSQPTVDHLDITKALTQAMLSAQIDIAERRVQEANIGLQKVKLQQD